MCGIDVLTAARARISRGFDEHDRVLVSTSGGKDSGVVFHLVAEEAERRGRAFHALFLDWEAQYASTIAYVDRLFHHPCVQPLWVCLPLTTTNGCSQIEPEWTCWDPVKRDLWVRDPPEGVITDPAFFPFYRDRMTFEEFVGGVEAWFGGVVFTGLRAEESHDRFLGTVARLKAEELLGQQARTKSPIYDWKLQDIWAYYAKSGHPYNPVYDRMYQAGVPISRMRICEPYGNEQRRGLTLFHVLEPETWPKVCARVAGAGTGALYAQEAGNVMGNRKIALPAGHTWESFALFLLDTMPTSTTEHYRCKIAVYLKWYLDHQGGIPDERPGDTGAKDACGSWRRICRALLKNDYWCISLGFHPTKTASYEAYRAHMKARRDRWGIFPPAGKEA